MNLLNQLNIKSRIIILAILPMLIVGIYSLNQYSTAQHQHKNKPSVI
ncbi:hypothetical protein [Algibacillus agarilyticus]|nr:hypothetical protein [Algibacillus agarilyticus]